MATEKSAQANNDEELLNKANNKFRNDFVPEFINKLKGHKLNKPNKNLNNNAEIKLDRRLLLIVFVLQTTNQKVNLNQLINKDQYKLKLNIKQFLQKDKAKEKEYENLRKKAYKEDATPEDQFAFLKFLIFMHFLMQKFEHLPENEQANILANNSSELGYEFTGMNTRESEFQVFRDPEFLKGQFTPEKFYENLRAKGVTENPDNNVIVGKDDEPEITKDLPRAFSTRPPGAPRPPGYEETN